MPQGSFAARRQVYILVHEQLLHTLRSALAAVELTWGAAAIVAPKGHVNTHSKISRS